MSKSTFSGPVRTGLVREGTYFCVGEVSLSQQWTIDVPALTITQPNGATVAITTAAGTFNSVMYVPSGIQILDVLVDVSTAYNQGTSAAVTIGSSVGGTQYVSSTSVASTGRTRPTFSAAQLLAMQSTAADSTASTAAGQQISVLNLQLISVGTAASTGHVIITVEYQQN